MLTPQEQFALRKGKDAAPEDTVRRIRGILAAFGFHERYTAYEPQLGTCYFSRVELGSFGSNGKGLSPAFCMASGYAELMERMQNRVMSAFARHDCAYSRSLAQVFPTCDLRTDAPAAAAELIERLRRSACAAGETPDRAAARVDALLPRLALDGRYVLRPFYALGEAETQLLPPTFFQLFTGTNGMAAGNTLEEAIVQGLSEVFERHATIRILFDGLTPPEIPRGYLRERYPKLAEIVAEIEVGGDYRVQLLDASLGVGVPCVACVVFNLKTLTCGVKFGAYPRMEIAIERCLSESVQGWKLSGFSKAGTITYAPLGRAGWVELLNILKVSKGSYPASMFDGEPSWTFTPWDESDCGDNRAMLRGLLRLLRSMGKRLYVRDVSFLGFPSVYLYVPEMSEIAPVDVLWLEERLLALQAQETFAHAAEATPDELRRLLTLCRIKRGSILENTIDRVAGTSFTAEMPGAPDHELDFLAAVCCFALGDDREAVRRFSDIPQTPYTLAVCHYLLARGAGMTPARAAQLLRKLTDAETARTVAAQFSERAGVLRRVYPACSGDCAACSTACRQPEIQRDYARLLELERANERGTDELRALFASL